LHELREAWNRESELIKELDIKGVEGRCPDLREKTFEVSTDTSK
jgi:hypothetical protein